MSEKYFIKDSALRWLEIILSERFGHTWHLSRSAEGLRLTLDGDEGSIVFDKLISAFYYARSDQPLTSWEPTKEGLDSVLGGAIPAPCVQSLLTPLIERRGVNTYVHYDIPGLCYWMLARIEELDRIDLDNHGRFSAKSSHAYKHGYLDRPIVDEWLHILGQIIKRQWIGIVLKRHEFALRVSHDVDRPSKYGFASAPTLLRRLIGDILRGNVQSALHGPLIRIKSRGRLHQKDPFNTFDWIMDKSELHAIKSTFFFIAGRTSRWMDGEYDIQAPSIRELLYRIYLRGHEIGLHPSYCSYMNASALKREADRLRKVLEGEGIRQAEFGARMHYLRWKQPETLRALCDAGISYDSTLTYADHAGFRCGTSFEFPGFDPKLSELLKIRVRPLIAMDVTIFGKGYQGLSRDDGLLELKKLKKRCEAVGGQFVLLWHNCELLEKSQNRDTYSMLLK